MENKENINEKEEFSTRTLPLPLYAIADMNDTDAESVDPPFTEQLYKEAVLKIEKSTMVDENRDTVQNEVKTEDEKETCADVDASEGKEEGHLQVDTGDANDDVSVVEDVNREKDKVDSAEKLNRTSKLKPINKISEKEFTEQFTDEKKAVELPEKKNMVKNILKELLDFFKTLLICGVSVFLLWTFVLRPVQVKGNSMRTTLANNSIGVSNTIGYTIGGVDRFDIVIIYLPEKDEYIVKRVIGLPGDRIRYEEDQLYINDVAVREEFLDEKLKEETVGTFTKDFDEIIVGNDEYFCMGDNRPHSQDSRYYGSFKKEQIVSKGIFILFPFTEFGVKTW